MEPPDDDHRVAGLGKFPSLSLTNSRSFTYCIKELRVCIQFFQRINILFTGFFIGSSLKNDSQRRVSGQLGILRPAGKSLHVPHDDGSLPPAADSLHLRVIRLAEYDDLPPLPAGVANDLMDAGDPGTGRVYDLAAFFLQRLAFAERNAVRADDDPRALRHVLDAPGRGKPHRRELFHDVAVMDELPQTPARPFPLQRLARHAHGAVNAEAEARAFCCDDRHAPASSPKRRAMSPQI